MHKIYFTLTTLALILLVAGCVSSAVAPPAEVKAFAQPPATEPPVQLQPVEITTSETVSKMPPADCPVTTTGILSFEAPAPFSATAPWPNIFWFGSEHLWTALPADGIWSDLPNNLYGYTQKIFWWSDLFSLKDEPEPDLVVTGERLDAKAPLFKVSRATNASAADIGRAILSGVSIPTPGCWKITGIYKDTTLSFVVWVAP